MKEGIVWNDNGKCVRMRDERRVILAEKQRREHRELKRLTTFVLSIVFT